MILTRSRAIDRLRSVQRGRRLKDAIESEWQTRRQFDDRSSFDAVASGETAKILGREAMQKLPRETREAIELAFLSSFTQAEIAEMLREPLGTVKARIRRGLLKLRDLLGPQL